MKVCCCSPFFLLYEFYIKFSHFLCYVPLAEDPIKVLKHSSDAMNSVLKMFIDIFSVAETAAMFYTNDTKVLIDIIVRQLTDLCAGNPVSTCYSLNYIFYF